MVQKSATANTSDGPRKIVSEQLSTARVALGAVASEGLSTEPARRAEQIAAVMSALTDAFRERSLRAVLVGGSAIEVWAPGAHVSDDMDIVVTGSLSESRPLPDRVADVFQELGFKKQGLGWLLGPIYVHVVGYDMYEPSATVELGALRFEAVEPEVPLADRMVGFKHWPNTTSYGQQAIAMLESLGDSLNEERLREQLVREDALDVLEALRALMRSGDQITEPVLSELQQRLRERHHAD